MQAVILAAGKGKRLKPLTDRRSKAMLPVLGQPIIERIMADLEANGIDEFILVISPDDKEITNHFQHQTCITGAIHFVHQHEQHGMAHALLQAAPLIEADFILSACDNLFPIDHIARMLKLWKSRSQPNAILTLMPVEQYQISSAGIVEKEGNWIKRIVEKPRPEQAPSNIASLPLYCLPHVILNYLPKIQPSTRGEYEIQDAIQILIEQEGRVYGLETETRMTLTSPDDLLTINSYYMASAPNYTNIHPEVTIGQNTNFDRPVHIESGTRIGHNCHIGPNVYIEQDCIIGNKVHIKDAIILSKSRITDGADINHQIMTLNGLL